MRPSNGEIMLTVVGQRDTISRCIARQRGAAPRVHGTLSLRWVIEPSGAVSSARSNTDEMKDSALATCLLHEIPSWQLPPFDGEPYPVDFPFKF